MRMVLVYWSSLDWPPPVQAEQLVTGYRLDAQAVNFQAFGKRNSVDSVDSVVLGEYVAETSKQ